MILYYTGAKTPNAIQIDSEKSLGGFVSSTPVPNSRIGNLFSGISKSVIIENRKEIRLIALKNTTGVAIANLIIFTNNKNKSFKFKIAAVASGTNSLNEIVFEEVQDGESLPYQAALTENELEINALSVGAMAIGQVIGIWIYRELDITKYPELITQVGQTAPLSTSALVAAILAQSQATEEDMDLVIKYDLVT